MPARKAKPKRGSTLHRLRRIRPQPGGRSAAQRRRNRRQKQIARAKAIAWRVFQGVSLVGAVVLVALTIGIGILASGLPAPENFLALKGAPSVTILDAQGRMIARRGPGQGRFVTLEELPDHMRDAVLAIEDRRFFSHWGVDLEAILRALLANVEAGRVVQGGSTITQQLAKMLFLEPDRTFKRKAEEVLLALYLEMRFTKPEILEMYLNRAYFGAGAYGLDSAARRYFNKPASDLTLPESAILAGVLKAPTRFSPASDFDAAQDRARLVLAAMAEEGFISPDARLKAQQTRPKLARSQGTPGLTYFVDWVMEDVQDFLGGLNTDLIIETTLNTSMQAFAEDAAAKALEGASGKQASQIAMVALDNSGAVLAMVGGRSYAISQFNHATQAKRQPGSAFKPFVYLAALESGREPNSLIEDGPLAIGRWTPANFDGRYEGEVSLTRALSRSLNSAAVRLILEVGPKAVARSAQRMGILSRLEPNASLALGTSEVTLLELVSAYVPFANGGDLASPYAIVRIKTSSGRVLYQRSDQTLGRALSPERAQQMNQMLAETIRAGTARGAFIEGRAMAGKTGTSQAFRDAWFIGYVNGLTTGVWVGNSDGTPMARVTGGSIPVQAWRGFMVEALTQIPDRPLPGADGTPGFDIASGTEGGFSVSGDPNEAAEMSTFDAILDALTEEGDPSTSVPAVRITGTRPAHKP